MSKPRAETMNLDGFERWIRILSPIISRTYPNKKIFLWANSIYEIIRGHLPPCPQAPTGLQPVDVLYMISRCCIEKDLLINIIVLANLFYKILFHVVNQLWWNRMGNGLRGIYSSNFCMIYFSRPPPYISLETYSWKLMAKDLKLYFFQFICHQIKKKDYTL